MGEKRFKKVSADIAAKKAVLDENLDPVVTYTRPKGFRVKRSLTQQVRSISSLGTCIVKCIGELITSEMPSQFSPTGRAEAISVDVIDQVSGESFTLVLNTVAASSLKRAGTPLADRYFEISVGDTENGKRYRHTEVNELEGGD